MTRFVYKKPKIVQIAITKKIIRKKPRVFGKTGF